MWAGPDVELQRKQSKTLNTCSRLPFHILHVKEATLAPCKNETVGEPCLEGSGDSRAQLCAEKSGTEASESFWCRSWRSRHHYRRLDRIHLN